MTRARYSASDNSLIKDSGEKIKCHDSCRGLWEDNDVLVHGKDYKVYEYEGRPIIAYPVMNESEDELWDSVIDEYLYRRECGVFRADIISAFQEKYTITRKQ